jgi:hypothetical protein
MPWKKRVLLHMEPIHFKDELSAAPAVVSSFAASSDVAAAFDDAAAQLVTDSGDVMKGTIITEQNDDAADERAPHSALGAPFDLAEESAPAESFDSMVG